MVLHPLRGPKQARLLPVPGAVHQGALGLIAFLGQQADGFGFFQHTRKRAYRIGRPIHPGIVVVAPDNPFVRILGAFHLGDHVVGRGDVPIKLNLEPNGRLAGPDMVGDRQRPPPFGRCHRPLQGAQQRQGVVVADGQYWYLQQALGIFAV